MHKFKYTKIFVGMIVGALFTVIIKYFSFDILHIRQSSKNMKEGNGSLLYKLCSYTDPTFTGTQASISRMQPYVTVYMYKRVS